MSRLHYRGQGVGAGRVGQAQRQPSAAVFPEREGAPTAVFLDKDGTLIENLPYNVEPERIRLTEGAGPALKRLQEAGFLLIVVSNQSGVARGLFPSSALAAVAERIDQLLAPYGVKLDGFRACPHHPSGTVAPYARDCDCRKPKPGLLLAAAEDLQLDLSRCWLVGDILDDVEAGNRAGCRSILLDNGGETEWRRNEQRRPAATVASLSDAAEVILAGDSEGKERECSTISSR